MVQPTAPMPPFGAFYEMAHGHVVTTVLFAMVAMLLTAVSYGRMARVYPSAGSAYSYVGQELHPALGFATGWSMTMDYLLNPLICVIWGSGAAVDLLPSIPYPVWAVFFAGLFTWANLRRIRATARINAWMAGIMFVVIGAMLVLTVRHIFGLPTLAAGFFTRPFYDPHTFSWSLMRQGTSLAVLTYIGFDGISTLSEETKDPRRTILRAMVITCLLIGVLSAIEVYAAQLVWPAGQTFPSVENAYSHVAEIVGGRAFGIVITLTLLVANFGSGAGAQLAGARLLYGMGRSNAIPKSFFGALSSTTRIPTNNVLLIGALALAGAFLISYERGAELLNFGALIGFMGVNLSSFVHYCVRGGQRSFSAIVVPLAGFVVCAALWWNLGPLAKMLGSVWVVFGIVYGVWKTNGFRKQLEFDIPPE